MGLTIALVLSGLWVVALVVAAAWYLAGRKRRERHERASEAILETDFWCERHRLMVIRSGADPVEATKALSIGLYLIGKPLNPIPEACCIFTDETIRGVLARCNRKI